MSIDSTSAPSCLVAASHSHDQVPNAYVFTAFGNSAMISMSHCKQDLTHHATCSARSEMLRARCRQGLFRYQAIKSRRNVSFGRIERAGKPGWPTLDRWSFAPTWDWVPRYGREMHQSIRESFDVVDVCSDARHRQEATRELGSLGRRRTTKPGLRFEIYPCESMPLNPNSRARGTAQGISPRG